MKKFEGEFHLALGEPVKIAQGEVGDQAWGHYQFPTIEYTKTGAIMSSWGYGEDKVGGKKHDGGVRPPFISYDGGMTWGPNEKGEEAQPKFPLANGKYFLGFAGKSAYPNDIAKDIEPVKRWSNWKGEHRMYFAEDFGVNDDTTFRARFFDPDTNTIETREVKVNWPHQPLIIWPGELMYPATQLFALCNCGITQKDGVLYCCLYFYGFNSAAGSREEAVLPYDKYNTYVFSSEDCGETWNYLSQISVDADTYEDSASFEGFGEPMLEKMPDGSFVMLLRTGSENTCYIVRSTDGCRTWTKPAKFDDFGVLPQIMTLPCGVTLAAYGRPRLRIRATADPSGMTWEDPITVPLSASEETSMWYTSCFYTHFLPVDDNSVLWIYTDFQNLNEDGEPAKAIMVRKVTVVKD